MLFEKEFFGIQKVSKPILENEKYIRKIHFEKLLLNVRKVFSIKKKTIHLFLTKIRSTHSTILKTNLIENKTSLSRYLLCNRRITYLNI